MSISPSAVTSNIPLWPEAYDLQWLWGDRKEAISPEPRLTVWEWADRYRELPAATSSEPGRWRTGRTPYLRRIMECLSATHPAEQIIFVKGSQLGASEVGNNWLGYLMHIVPGLILSVWPTLNDLKKNTSTRIDPLIASTPALRERVAPPRSRDGGNSLFRKQFVGGELVMTGSNSAVGLRSTPARYLILEEVDGYPADADGEGDPVDLAVQRTVTFRNRRKIYMPSTPTVEGESRIWKAYEETAQEKYFVPCLGCGVFEWIQWDNIRYPEGAPYNAVYQCPSCGYEHQEHEKTELLARGQWRPTAKDATGGRKVGFHISSLYSPFEPWGDIAADFVDRHRDPNRLKTWVNLKLGEPWQERGEAPDWENLFGRREPYEMGQVPAPVRFVTAGADVQADRIEVEVKGWGEDKQSWSIEHRVFEGDTSNTADPCWGQLKGLLDEHWPHAGGVEMPLVRLGIDEGYNTQVVRAWARNTGDRRVLVLKGQDRATVEVGLPTTVDINHKGKRIRRGMRVYPVGVSMLKTQLYGWLKMERPDQAALDEGAPYPPGYCHYPEYAEEWFRQICAEQRVKRVHRGYEVWEWQKTRERNEGLDLHIYAWAAAIQFGLNRLKAAQWAEMARALGVDPDAEEAAQPEERQPPAETKPQSTPRRRKRRSIRGSYMR